MAPYTHLRGERRLVSGSRGSAGSCPLLGASSTAIPGGTATFDVVVVDTGSPEGDAVYWAGAVDADAQALVDLDAVRADLRLSD